MPVKIATDSKARSRAWILVPASLLALCLLLAACMRTTGTAPAGPASQLAAAKATPAANWAEFHKSVQPFLAQHCYSCHGADDAENDLRLDLFHDQASLEAGSAKLEKALDKLKSHKMPPRDEPQPAEAEVAPVVGWLQTYLAGEATGPINPGRVTIRRLNRAEYNNTVRDLLAIDFRPADAFPVDDAGYGFDNNGDVLSLAPVLMEKYLAAGSLSLEKAIFVDPIVPPPLKRWDASTAEGSFAKSDPKATVPEAGPGPAGRPRVLPAGRVFEFKGAIYADYEVPAEGDYNFRVRAYGTQGSASHQRPSVVFLVDGLQVQDPFTIKEDQRNTSVYTVEKAHVTAGQHRITLAFLNGATEEEYTEAVAKAKASGAKPAMASTNDDDNPNPAAAAPAAGRRGRAKLPAAKPAADDAAAADAADAAADAADAAVADNPVPPAAPAPAGARGRSSGAGPGQRGAAGPAGARAGLPPQGFRAGPVLSPTGKPTLGVAYFELEGPLAPTIDRMPESYRRVMVALPSATVTKPQAAEKVIRNFATRAYRRPVRDEEVVQLMGLWSKADSDGRTFDQSIDLVLQAVMVSPSFLFRMESEPLPGEKNGVHTLNEYELATRLSYFLWSSMPDDELFALAAKGQLRQNLDAQVHRMLKDPKSSALVENFAGQWLQLRSMQNVTPDAKRFPNFDESLRDAMTKETQLFFNAIVQEDRDVMDFVDADFTYVNERLAKHYGLPGVTGEEFRRVTLPKDQRGGILTQASVLTITSYPGRTSPVQRGKWVLENLLDAAPPPPPPNVPALAEGDKAELTGTLRQRMEQHRKDPKCAACHERMDGIGFALENFDAIGAWRTTDINNEKIDPAGTLPGGKTFNGPAELREILKAQSDEFCRCVAGKMMTFALGRGLESYDRRTTDAVAAAMKQQDNKFSVMIEAIVRSDAFQKRNGKTKTGDS